MQRTVVFVLSANYSGSTWLSLLLGSHSQAFYVGELNKMFHDDPVPCRLCEERGVPCPVFHDADRIKAKNIHDAVLQRTGAKVLVDNSKTLSWSRKFLAEERFQRKYIHLIRDPRAIAYSLQLRDKPIKLDKWVKKNREIREFLETHHLDYQQVLYNELAENMDAELKRLCEWLGLEYEPAQKAYWNAEHHGPGRNGATAGFLQQYVASDAHFYEQNKQRNFHDLRWKTQLSAENRQAIREHAGLQAFLHDFGLEFDENGLRLRTTQSEMAAAD